MSQNNYYITTPVFYVNDVPHIGHAYTSIVCDVISRYMKLCGKNVKFITGTDEHGQKVEKSAWKANMSPQNFVDKNADIFRNMTKILNLSHNDFIRTTEDRHKIAVHDFWKKLEDSHNIYKGTYSGWYSVQDETYFTEDELTKDRLAPTGAPVEWVEEPSYFFALSKWQTRLLQHYENNPDFIQPKSLRNEVISFIRNGLTDLSVSRNNFSWGIKVPGNEEYVIYVWLDALVNYLSALGYPNQTMEFSNFWPESVHVIGKDILRFHAVYWPAFLMAANIVLPKSIVAHGWWTNEGQKISKSLGNVISPFDLVQEFGVDPVRYFLMREITFGTDGNFVKKNLILRYNTELANKVGNLLQRTLCFAYKYCDQKIPAVEIEYIDKLYNLQFFQDIICRIQENNTYIKLFNINKILDNIIHMTDEANRYIDIEQPWLLRTTDVVKMQQVLYGVLEIVRYLGIVLQVFVPNSASNMLNQLGISQDQRQFKHLSKEFALQPGAVLKQPTPVFLRI